MKSITDLQFDQFQKLIYEHFGIYLGLAKKEMLQAKLQKLMRRSKIDSYDQYYQQLINGFNQEIWSSFIDEITIHKTGFFREPGHFDFLSGKMDHILRNNPAIKAAKEIRVWSAGCSTGEEAYTIVMVLMRFLPPEIKIKVLATDISKKVLTKAQAGTYPLSITNEIEPSYLEHYFTKSGEHYQVEPFLQELVTFRLLNLIAPFHFQKSFDLIFCRNVMIYFNQEIQRRLIERLYQVLTPGGFLMIGHSESLSYRIERFQYVQPSIYLKPGK